VPTPQMKSSCVFDVTNSNEESSNMRLTSLFLLRGKGGQVWAHQRMLFALALLAGYSPAIAQDRPTKPQSYVLVLIYSPFRFSTDPKPTLEQCLAESRGRLGERLKEPETEPASFFVVSAFCAPGESR
jgi:hypothetical protein